MAPVPQDSRGRDKDDVPGHSMKHLVNHQDEWCAEAYMETDYSTITRTDYEKAVKKMLIFKLFNEAAEGV